MTRARQCDLLLMLVFVLINKRSFFSYLFLSRIDSSPKIAFVTITTFLCVGEIAVFSVIFFFFLFYLRFPRGVSSITCSSLLKVFPLVQQPYKISLNDFSSQISLISLCLIVLFGKTSSYSILGRSGVPHRRLITEGFKFNFFHYIFFLRHF